MVQPLSASDARKLVLHSQRLLSRQALGSGREATLAAIEHLGYIQLDTLSVVARAHLHTLWNRLDRFRAEHVDALQRERKVFEHWAHALAILPMRDYRYSLPMMKRIAAGDRHWYPKDSKQARFVLDRIRAEGPLSARDFDDRPASKAMWETAPSKRALEQLFIEGELMIPHRVNFQKVYDLRERVLPDDVDVSEPGEDEMCRHLIDSFLRANGLGQAAEFGYLRRGMGPALRHALAEMQEAGEVLALRVGERQYYCRPPLLKLLQEPLPRSQLRILSPFDNAIIQRKRTHALFGFDYQIECYVKKEQRRFGYFCLPLLYRGRLVGRLDAKADRKAADLQLLHLQLEPKIGDREALYRALLPELKKFARFNGCSRLTLHRLSGCDTGPGWTSLDLAQ